MEGTQREDPLYVRCYFCGRRISVDCAVKLRVPFCKSEQPLPDWMIRHRTIHICVEHEHLMKEGPNGT